MPISLTDIDDGTTQFGIGSYLAVGTRTARGDAGNIGDIDNFHNIPYLVQTAEIAGNAPGIEIPIVGDSPADFPRQQGPLDIINGFTLPAYTTKMEPFYRQLLNDDRALVEATTTVPTLAGSRETEIGGRVARLSNGATALGDGLDLTRSSNTRTPLGSNLPRPVRVFITLPSAVATEVTIHGTDYHNTRISEVVTISSGTTGKTTQYFKTVTGASSDPDTTGVDLGEDDTAGDRPYRSIFWENEQSKLTPGMDVYVQKGTVPNTYREVFIDSLSFSMSRDGAVAFTFATVGKRPYAHRAVDESSTGPEEISSWTAIDREAFTGWQCGIHYVDGSETKRLPAIDTTVTFANNIAFAPTITGFRHPGGTFRTRRNITFEGTMEYRSEDSDLINDVLGNQFLEGAYLEMVNAATGGFPYKVRFQFGRLQFTNVPDAPISEEGIISRPMSMIAVPDTTVTPAIPDMRILMEVLTPVELDALTL